MALPFGWNVRTVDRVIALRLLSLRSSCAHVSGNRLSRFIVDDFYFLCASGPVPHHHHGAFAAIFQLVEGSPGDQRCHAWFKDFIATIWEMHSAFSVNDIKGLVYGRIKMSYYRDFREYLQSGLTPCSWTV